MPHEITPQSTLLPTMCPYCKIELQLHQTGQGNIWEHKTKSPNCPVVKGKQIITGATQVVAEDAKGSTYRHTKLTYRGIVNPRTYRYRDVRLRKEYLSPYPMPLRPEGDKSGEPWMMPGKRHPLLEPREDTQPLKTVNCEYCGTETVKSPKDDPHAICSLCYYALDQLKTIATHLGDKECMKRVKKIIAHTQLISEHKEPITEQKLNHNE